MSTLLHDLRYSLRQFLKTPGFTLTAVISLALGIGATTAVFSVIYAALLNPYPYHAADRIVRLTVQSKADPEGWVTLDGQQIQQLRQLRPIESLLAMDFHALTWSGHELPENVNAISLISSGYLLGGTQSTAGVPFQSIMSTNFQGNPTRPICNCPCLSIVSWASG